MVWISKTNPGDHHLRKLAASTRCVCSGKTTRVQLPVPNGQGNQKARAPGSTTLSVVNWWILFHASTCTYMYIMEGFGAIQLHSVPMHRNQRTNSTQILQGMHTDGIFMQPNFTTVTKAAIDLMNMHQQICHTCCLCLCSYADEQFSNGITNTNKMCVLVQKTMMISNAHDALFALQRTNKRKRISYWCWYCTFVWGDSSQTMLFWRDFSFCQPTHSIPRVAYETASCLNVQLQAQILMPVNTCWSHRLVLWWGCSKNSSCFVVLYLALGCWYIVGNFWVLLKQRSQEKQNCFQRNLGTWGVAGWCMNLRAFTLVMLLCLAISGKESGDGFCF